MKERMIGIVTGGASGLGLATVKRLATKYPIAIVDIAEEKGKQVEKELRDEGLDVTYFPADLTLQENANTVVEVITDQLGTVSTLVNAAGIIRRTVHAQVKQGEIKAVLDINLLGTVYMCQAVYPYMKQVGEGYIVNFASMLAHYGSKNLLSYAASKGGIVQITKCLAVDWAQDGIRVNAISPGYIETPLSAGATKDPAFNERILSRTPQRRYGKPEEVASVIDFLCSEDASFITGVVLPIDGGLLAGDPSLFPPASL